jgi:transcriptional regulator with XRE-family HTH domain
MEVSMNTNTKLAAYKGYGGLIHAWRNEIKFTLEMVSQDTGISKDRLVDLENGCEKPTWGELEKLAIAFKVSVRDLLPFEDDRQQGIIILENKDARSFDQVRAGTLQYTYTCKAMSSGIPNFKPVELLLHLTDKNKVVINRGHFFHQYTQVLYGGPVGFVWICKGKKLYQEFSEGDSWIIPGFVPHGFWSPDPDSMGKILAITFGQHLASGDARQELNLISPENAPRIIDDKGDYYSK